MRFDGRINVDTLNSIIMGILFVIHIDQQWLTVVYSFIIDLLVSFIIVFIFIDIVIDNAFTLNNDLFIMLGFLNEIILTNR